MGKKFRAKVAVRDVTADFILHDVQALGIAAGMSSYKEIVPPFRQKTELILSNGESVELLHQSLWKGLGIFQLQGSGLLRFDGASKQNPNGPGGYGYEIEGSKNNEPYDVLVSGYGYGGMGKSSNEMEYAGLIEGLQWAKKLEFENLLVRGDSKLVIHQAEGTYQAREPRLVVLLNQVKALLDESRELGMEVRFEHIPRESNKHCDTLANLAIQFKENTTSCNWENINRLKGGRV